MFVVYSYVLFVSIREILECRVYTIESEILHVEEAIFIQENNDILVSIHISIYHLLRNYYYDYYYFFIIIIITIFIIIIIRLIIILTQVVYHCNR